jgi:UDP-glucose 4-epimerase
MPETILVTGATGVLGGWVAHELRNHTSVKVRLGVRSPTTAPLGQEVTYLDLSDESSIRSALRGVDKVIHLAGVPQSLCESNPQLSWVTNVEGTANLARVSAKSGVRRFVQVSTIHVYGDPLPHIISAETPLFATSRYGRIHLAAEEELKNTGQMSVDIARLCNGFGVPQSKANCWHLAINDFARQAVRSSRIYLNSSGLQQRNFVPIKDSAAFLVFLLQREPIEKTISTWVYGSPQSHSVIDIANRVAARWMIMSGKTTTVMPSSSSAAVPEATSCIDLQPVLRQGFTASFSLEHTIDELLTYCTKTSP